MKYPIEFDRIPFFSTEGVRTSFPLLKQASVYQKVKRFLDKRDFFQLKKGLYMTAPYKRLHETEQNLKIFIANHLRYPSYVSGAYALQRYDMMTEMTYPVTSVTLKSSRTYTNSLGTFMYSSITENLYQGYRTEKYREEKVYIASRAKALFDFFYFKYAKAKDLPADLREKERIAVEKLTTQERKEFKMYCKLAHLGILKQLPYLLFYA